MSYKIGSMNMYKFQANRSDKEISKDIDLIAEIIYTEKFDIVAMQEIYSDKAMNMVLRRLGGNWEGRWATPNSKSALAAEGYAFIWNKRRIELAESLTTTGKKVFEPRIYEQYKVDRGKGQQELLRNPFYGRFKPKNAFMEIRLINTHIVFSANKADRDEDEEAVPLGSTAMRKQEFDVLVNSIYAKEEDKIYGTNMPAYTILVGDYNLNLNRGCKGPYVDEVVEIYDNSAVKRIRTVQDELTTLKQKSRSNPDEPVTEFANNYDHFSYDEVRFQGVDVKSGRVNTVSKYCGNDFDKHRKIISDHVPVNMEIKF